LSPKQPRYIILEKIENEACLRLIANRIGFLRDLQLFQASSDSGVYSGPGGAIVVTNKTGDEIVQLYADDYGNGVVGAFNRKGKGRTLQPRP
jgi:hypothetical protein